MGLLRLAVSDPREFVREPALRAQARSKLLAPWWRHRFHHFGADSLLDWPAWLYGPHQIAVGERSMLLRSVWLAVEKPAWGRPAPVLSIGSGVSISPWTRISANESIVIEDFVVLAARVTVIDSTHTHAGEEALGTPGVHHSVLHTPNRSAPIRLGQGTWVGDNATILPGATIGRHCTIGAGSVVTGDVPDFSVAVGAPARVVGDTRS